ncbi:hypothetical protein GNP73_17365 [Aliivibrio fischeri]|uniref:hypothetical protein n=1 Tax=Aliivibrio fischeri TaxID=668 RepID=UPI0012DAD51E|nr:hypothetical protein [Aliivibrio fischeri]MUJ29737.1 hypothetical protein [Aliivibrio fischeri]
MKYKLGLRPINESDIGIDCPFMPENENYDSYVSAFVEEINNLEIVKEAIESEGCAIIELENNVSLDVLRESLKSLHQSFWELLRTTGFESIA